MLALGIALVAVAVTWLLPLVFRLRHVEAEIRTYQNQLLEQEMAKPLKGELDRMIVQQQPNGLEAPTRTPLRSADLPRLPEIFRAPAREAGLELVQLSPDVQTLSIDEYRHLTVSATVSGNCKNFHPYLISVCKLPFLTELRQVAIRRTGPGEVQMVVTALLDVEG
jgi:hypothetical protein